MSLVLKILFYIGLAIAVLIFLNLNVRISLSKRLWISILTPLILIGIFLLFSTIIAFVLVIIAVILLISLLAKTTKLFGKNSKK